MSGATILVTQVGCAEGARAAAAALACVGGEPDCAALLVELGDGRPPRSTLVASAAARVLEERLAGHMPEAGVASRGFFCHLLLPADAAGLARVGGALAIGRGAACVVLVPPCLLRPALGEVGIGATAALLRADLAEDRALTALATRDLSSQGLHVAVLKRPLGRLASRRALVGALPAGRAAGCLVDWSGDSSATASRTRATLIEMARKLSQRELRNNSGEIMRALDRGEDFVVTRNGVPVGELRPYKPRQFVPRDVLLAAFAGSPHIDYEQFRADIDAVVDQDPTPRF